MITSVEGIQGNCKSLSAVTMAYLEWNSHQRKVMSNIYLNFPFQQFDTAYFMDHLEDEELENCLLILDETYLLLDGRTSRGKFNKLFTYFVAQARKRDVDLLVCFHHIDMIDKRLKRAIDVRGTCRFRLQEPCRKCKGTGYVARGACPDCHAFGVQYDGTTCPTCGGTGEGEACPVFFGTRPPADSGYPSHGFASTSFFNRRTLKRFRMKIHGPTYYGLYSTVERVPFLKKQTKINLEDL